MLECIPPTTCVCFRTPPFFAHPHTPLVHMPLLHPLFYTPPHPPCAHAPPPPLAQVRQCLDATLLLESSTLDSSAPATVSAVSTGFSSLTGYSQLEMLGSNCLCLAGAWRRVEEWRGRGLHPQCAGKRVLCKGAGGPLMVRAWILLVPLPRACCGIEQV